MTDTAAKIEIMIANPLRDGILQLAIVGQLCFEGYLVHLLFNEKITVNSAVVIHFSVALIVVLAAFCQLHRSISPWILLLSMLSAAFGLLGTTGFIGILLFRAYFLNEDAQSSEILKMLVPNQETTLAKNLCRGIGLNPKLLEQQEEVVPFIERLRFGDRDQKREVLTHIGSHYVPGFAPLLRDCMQNAESAIRVQAATVLTTVANRYQDDVLKAEALYRQDETDENLLTLAKAHDYFSFSDTLDEQRAKQVREEAICCYRRYLFRNPNAADAVLDFGRLLYRWGEYAEAYDVLKAASTQIEEKKSAIAGWLIELCYCLKRYDELRERAHAALSDVEIEEIPIQLHDAIGLWARKGSETVQLSGERS